MAKLDPAYYDEDDDLKQNNNNNNNINHLNKTQLISMFRWIQNENKQIKQVNITSFIFYYKYYIPWLYYI